MGFWDWVADIADKATAPVFNKGRPHNTYKNMFEIWGLARDAINDDDQPWRSNPNAVRNLERLGRPAFPKKSLRRQPKGPPSVEDILAQLERLQDPSRYLMGMGDLSSQAMAAASAQYDPLIRALEQQMGSATSRANKGKTELGQMFSALSTDLQGDIPEIQQQYATSKQQTTQNYADLQASIKNQYAQSQAEQEDMLQRLNIEAAAAETLPEQQRDRDYFTQLAAAEGQTHQTALGQEERGAIEYTRQGSQIAKMEGTQRQANLMSELEELLRAYESQIGSHRAAKQSAYTAGLGELENAARSDAMDMAQRDFQNYIAMIQLGRDLRKDETGKPIGPVRSPADVSGRALGMGLDQGSAQNIQDVFMSAIGNDPSILAGINEMSGGALSKEALAKRIIEAGRASGLNPEEINALQVIALEYFGRK